jgi:hypothetical protein
MLIYLPVPHGRGRERTMYVSFYITKKVLNCISSFLFLFLLISGYLKKGFLHCKEIWIYVCPEKELLGLRPNFHIHVSVSVLYIPTFGLPTFLQQNRQSDQGNI